MIKIENKKSILPMILIILDGWGITKPGLGNATTLAKTPTINGLTKKFPSTALFAHGKHVGLSSEQPGNSEAGHMNIGAGRIIKQDSVIINNSINDGTFFKNPAFIEVIKHIKNNKSKLHLMGLISNCASAHSDPKHLLALLTLIEKYQVKEVYLHLFTDGRDSPKYSSCHISLRLFFRNMGIFHPSFSFSKLFISSMTPVTHFLTSVNSMLYFLYLFALSNPPIITHLYWLKSITPACRKNRKILIITWIVE